MRQARESHAVRWIAPDEVKACFDEESVLRMGRKADDWLARDPVGPPRMG